VVSVPAIVRTCASSERRTSRFSSGGNLESSIEWKMVGWSAFLSEAMWPDVRAWTWVKTAWGVVRLWEFEGERYLLVFELQT
jgi:hypothetical protein